MTKKEEPEEGGGEVRIEIDIFGSKEVDLAPSKKYKKRRTADDYDYNDPFLEPMEGEFEPVEIECKLENFFIYKGELEDDPKRIARKANQETRRKKLKSGGFEAQEEMRHFIFENILDKSAADVNKYKKDVIFGNLILWVFYTEKKENEFVLKRFGKDGKTVYGEARIDSAVEDCIQRVMMGGGEREDLLEQEKEKNRSFVDGLKRITEAQYNEIASIVCEETNYDASGKSFKLFKEEDTIYKFIRFYVLYISYYSMQGEINIQTTRNRATEYLVAAFPTACTNHVKMKFFIRKAIEGNMKENGYSVEQGRIGNYVKEGSLDDGDKGETLDGTLGDQVTSLDLMSRSKDIGSMVFENETEEFSVKKSE